MPPKVNTNSLKKLAHITAIIFLKIVLKSVYLINYI
jgi:hypothetical protein